MAELEDQIADLISHHQVVLFMKGTAETPRCGHSARAVEVLERCGVEFEAVDVLADPAMGDGIKTYSKWPTLPQAYIDGEFVGGSDILARRYDQGDLQKQLGAEPEEDPPPTIELTVTYTAQEVLAGGLEQAGEGVARFTVSPSFHYDLTLGTQAESDVVVRCGKVDLHVPRHAASRAHGTTIDFVSGPDGEGFRIKNPNEPPRPQPVMPAELQRWLDGERQVHLYDVRNAAERAQATIAQAEVMGPGGDLAAVAGLPTDTTIVLFCHHGLHSGSTAARLCREGYTEVHVLTGGIDAWAAEIDRSVPRY
ncbi:MAG: Grx4 family monothiol glutaredoxin [Deltaproteobacteria bacterium]|nr:Grx4 family monothiol glutaredoxin [Deltaproteobacteria bacterium]